MAGPVLPNLEALISAGIDPKTGLPIKLADDNIKHSVKILLRILDEQEFVNRYVWKNIPANITSQELERMLYYRGQLAIFYAPDVGDGEFFITPFALDGGIDFYGRYRTIKPVPFSSGVEDYDKTKYKVSDNTILTGLRFKCLYNFIENPTTDDKKNYCILIRDYTQQLSQTVLPRAQIQEAIIDTEAECIPYMRTNLMASSGARAIRVADSDSAKEVTKASNAIKKNAMSGEILTPVQGALEMQDLFEGQVSKSSEFMLAMQSIDNFRLRLLGIKSGGVFEKKSHTLEGEQSLNEGISSLSIVDGLKLRKNVCNLVNSLWGVGMDVEIAEEVNNQEKEGETPNYYISSSSKKGGNPNGNNDSGV